MLSIFSIDPCVFHHPFSRALDEHSMGLFSTRMLILQHQSLLAAGLAPPGSEGRPCLSQPVPTSRRASSGPHPKRLPCTTEHLAGGVTLCPAARILQILLQLTPSLNIVRICAYPGRGRAMTPDSQSKQ